MTFSTINHYLMPIAFTFLFILMLLYWAEAAFFGFEPPAHYKASTQKNDSALQGNKRPKNVIQEREKRSLHVQSSAPPSGLYWCNWREKYKIFTHFIFILSILSLTLLIVFRWVESGHFPLSNLYESLLFLSWCFLSLKFVFFVSPFLRGNVSINDTSLSLKTKAIDRDASLDVEFASTLPSKPFTNSNSTAANEAIFSNLGLGVILSPLSLLTFGFAFLSLPKEMQQSTSLVPALQSNWLMMHVTVMVLSYAALISGSILAIAFLILKYLHLQRNVPNLACAPEVQANPKGEQSFTKNVPLYAEYENQKTLNVPDFRYNNLSSRLDNLSYRILALGFPLLTIGILSGAVWANEAWGSYWSWDPKETWALITWLVFAIYLHTRITKGWSGEKSAIVASVGFFMVWFCYLGVNLLGSGLHSYGWFSN